MEISRVFRGVLVLSFLCAGLFSVNGAAAPSFIYVDRLSLATAPDGLAWETAFRTIHEGITEAVSLGTSMVRVAGGIYPETVTLAADLWLMGGYLGNSDPEAAPQDRDLEGYPTIIDGENTRVCVIGSTSTLLDGITVARGHGTHGGGVVSINTQVGATNCVFMDNTADVAGGGAYCEGSTGYFHLCTFKGNSALDSGGGLASMDSTVRLLSCKFFGNSAPKAGGAQYAGGSSTLARNCVFARNFSALDASAFASINTPAIISNCTFAANSGLLGATLTHQYMTAMITNCIFWDETPLEVTILDAPTTVISYCDIKDGGTSDGNINDDPRFRNLAQTDFHLTITSPCIDSGRNTNSPSYGTVLDDIEGNTRQAFFAVPGGDGSGYDMGAFEFSPTAVTFADTLLESVVRTAVGIPSGTLYADDVTSLAYLQGASLGIASLSGIAACVSLETLILPGNNIVDVTPLSQLPSLGFLNLEQNNIVDIAPLLLNTGIGIGDTINLLGDPLSAGSLNVVIPALTARGVTVFYGDTDFDSDGLSDSDETDVHDTDPYDPDTDGDGIYDGDEVANDLDPRDDEDAALDVDGDGLTALEEIAEHTNPHNPDTDGDGMADGFEVQYDLNPLNPADAANDVDGDRLTNLEEYQQHSDPTDATSPYPIYFVSTAIGADVAANGSLAHPWQTIGYSLSHMPTGSTTPTLVILAGVYAEDVTLVPGVRLVNMGDGLVIIEGEMKGAEGCWIRNIEIREPEAGATGPLLTLNNEAMVVREVVFRGIVDSTATGVATHGVGAGPALFTDCAFTSLDTGVEVFDAIPRIRRSLFDQISGNAIVIHQGTPMAGDNGHLGNTANPNSGWNTFRDVNHYAVVNEREEQVLVQRANWNTDDTGEIEDKVSGDVDTEDPLLKSASLTPGSIVCTVYDEETQTPITDASIQLSPGNFSAVTDNTEGVYAFACLSAGSYTVRVTADGFTEATKNVTVADGAETALVFAMSAESNDDGDGGCGTVDGAFTGGAKRRAGDVLLLALLAGTLAIMRLGPRRPAVLRRTL